MVHSLISPAFEHSDPPPAKPHFYRFGSSSNLTIGQQSLFAGLPTTAASLKNTISTTSRLTPQTTSQELDYSSPASPVSQSEHGRMHENQKPRPHVQPSESIGRRPSRKYTGPSEPPTPLPVDPHQHGYDELHKAQARNVYGHTRGAGTSRTDIQNTLHDKDRPRRDVGDKGSRELFIHPLV